EAKNVAAYNTSREWISRFNVVDIRAILEALPEPEQDDWQECTFEDIRKGDRVRAISPNGDLSEFTVKHIDRLLAHGEYDEVAHTTTATFYRIPAPVQHPDPDFHPVVISSV